MKQWRKIKANWVTGKIFKHLQAEQEFSIWDGWSVQNLQRYCFFIKSKFCSTLHVNLSAKIIVLWKKQLCIVKPRQVS